MDDVLKPIREIEITPEMMDAGAKALRQSGALAEESRGDTRLAAEIFHSMWLARRPKDDQPSQSADGTARVLQR